MKKSGTTRTACLRCACSRKEPKRMINAGWWCYNLKLAGEYGPIGLDTTTEGLPIQHETCGRR